MWLRLTLNPILPKLVSDNRQLQVYRDDTTIIFAWKKIRRERKKLFTTTTESFEYKHKTTAISIEETHII